MSTLAGPRPKLGAENAFQVSHVGSRHTTTWTITTASQGLRWWEAGVEVRAGKLTQHAAREHGCRTAKLNTHCGFPSLCGWITFCDLCVLQPIYPFTCWWILGLLPSWLSRLYCGQVHVRVPAFHLFGYRSRSGISGSRGDSRFNFLRHCHAGFHSGTMAQQQWTRLPVSLLPIELTLVIFFFSS